MLPCVQFALIPLISVPQSIDLSSISLFDDNCPTKWSENQQKMYDFIEKIQHKRKFTFTCVERHAFAIEIQY